MKSTFGGGGEPNHYGSLQKPATYLIEAGKTWTVPKKGGVYPTYTAGMNDAEKKREVAMFMLIKNNIKKAKVTQ